jgi:hypothetical protein
MDQALLEGFKFLPMTPIEFITNLIVAFLLAYVLKLYFMYFSSTLSGRAELARILPFLALIVCLVIGIVKTSLALSLGLVGALSIVRFRTPIKEPEELAYLFMAIGIGLGCGAGQILNTALATFCVLILMTLSNLKTAKSALSDRSMYISVNWDTASDVSLQQISSLVGANTTRLELKRHDDDSQVKHASFKAYLKDLSDIEMIIANLKSIDSKIQVTVIDQNRVPGV